MSGGWPKGKKRDKAQRLKMSLSQLGAAMNRLAAKWISYKDEVVPPDAGENQLDETQKAFYAGAIAMWQMLMQEVGELSDEDAEKRFEEIDTELQSYLAKVMLKTGYIKLN